MSIFDAKAHPARVLLAVADRKERDDIGDCLIKEGMAITLSTQSGEEAFQSLFNVKTRPDIVVADLYLPGMDAIDLLNQMHEKLLSVPMIVLSDTTNSASASLVSQSGADAIIIKPYNLRSLHQQICMILGLDVERTGDSTEDVIRRKARQILLDLGVPAGNRGFEYCVYAVTLCLQDENIADQPQRLIAAVADHFSKSYCAMGRALRRAITEARDKR